MVIKPQTLASTGPVENVTPQTVPPPAANTESAPAESNPADIFNDLESLRKQSKPTITRKTELVNVAVGRPSDRVYFRSNPDPVMVLENATILVDKSDKRACYFITPAMRNHHKLITRLRWVTLAMVYSWPSFEVGIWPVPVLSEGGNFKPWRSERRAFELSQTEWVQVAWNGRDDFTVEHAEGMAKTDPVRPKENFTTFLKLGFQDHIIDNAEHPYVLQLRGIND